MEENELAKEDNIVAGVDIVEIHPRPEHHHQRLPDLPLQQQGHRPQRSLYPIRQRRCYSSTKLTVLCRSPQCLLDLLALQSAILVGEEADQFLQDILRVFE